MAVIEYSSRAGGVALAAIVLVATATPPALGVATTSSLAEDAYYQIEGNVFEPAQIQEAIMKLKRARDADANDPWVFLTASLAVLVSGYTIGDWYSMNTFTEGTVDEAFRLASKAREIAPRNAQCQAHFARLLIVKGE